MNGWLDGKAVLLFIAKWDELEDISSSNVSNTNH